MGNVQVCDWSKGAIFRVMGGGGVKLANELNDGAHVCLFVPSLETISLHLVLY